MSSDLTIGALCRIAAVTPRTVRHYETEGILSPSVLTAGGRKLYPEDAADIIRLVQVLRECGYSLKMVRRLLNRMRPGAAVPVKAAAKLRKKLSEISDELGDRINMLNGALNNINRVLENTAGCDSCPGAKCKSCPSYSKVKTLGMLSPDNSLLKGGNKR